MEKFKVGDRVRCIHSYEGLLELGEIYTVVSIFADSIFVKGMKSIPFHSKSFVLVAEKDDKINYYAMFNKTTMEIKCLSITEDQLASKISTTKGLDGFVETKLWL